MVAKAKEELEQEMEEKEEQKAKYLEEKVPPLQVTGMSLADLKVTTSVKNSQEETYLTQIFPFCYT